MALTKFGSCLATPTIFLNQRCDLLRATLDEVIGEERFVDELHTELKAKRYKASPVRRAYTESQRETATTGNTDGGFILHLIQRSFRIGCI
jgi:hypothetical protein